MAHVGALALEGPGIGQLDHGDIQSVQQIEIGGSIALNLIPHGKQIDRDRQSPLG